MKFFITILLFIITTNLSFAQTDTSKLLVGTWDVCISLDTLNISCTKPFTSFQLRLNGEYQSPGCTCDNKDEPLISSWKYKDRSIYISAFKNACCEMPANGYFQINFVNDDLFYTRHISSTGENNGSPIFMIVKRRK
jgi:hypothetical protein